MLFDYMWKEMVFLKRVVKLVKTVRGQQRPESPALINESGGDVAESAVEEWRPVGPVGPVEPDGFG